MWKANRQNECNMYTQRIVPRHTHTHTTGILLYSLVKKKITFHCEIFLNQSFE